MRTNFWTLAVGAAGVLGAHSAAAQGVTPTFAWPVGATAQVVTEVRTTISGGGGGTAINDSSVTRTTFTYDVRAHAEGLEIVTSRGVVEKLVASALPQEVDAAALAALGSRFIVSRDGQFVRLSDVAAQKRVMDSAMAPMMDRMRQMAPAMVSVLEQSLSADALTANSRSSWRDSYASMYGRSWAPGDSQSTVSVIPSPLSPALKMSIPRVMRFDGIVPCADPARRTCWQFTARTNMTRAAMRPSMIEMLKQMGMAESMVDQIPIPESTTTLTAQVDAATMLPLRLEVVTTGGGSGGLMAMLTATTSVTTYRWK